MSRRMIVRPSDTRNNRAEPFEVFTRPQRSLPARIAGLMLRLRAEITTAAVLLIVWLWLAGLVDDWPITAAFGELITGPPDTPDDPGSATTGGLLLSALVVALLVGVVFAVPRSRRFVVRRGWAVMSRHRLRAVFVERRVMNYTGNLPVVVWARPTAVGERVWLVLRAGIELGDVERNLDYIASGCWGHAARAEARRSMTALVVVDVVRRDPLSTGPAVVSPIPHVVPAPVPVLEGA